MNMHRLAPPAPGPRRSTLLGLGLALAFGLGACSGGTALSSGAVPTVPSSIVVGVPTMPTESDLPGCIDAPTMAIVDQLRASGADVPALLTTNKDALIEGLGGLESDDPTTNSWRDALVTALSSDDTANALLLINRLRAGEIPIASC